ncbi:MAG: hypothetical protein ABIR37_04105 [Candidatus Saccharimonadales bacterium]
MAKKSTKKPTKKVITTAKSDTLTPAPVNVVRPVLPSVWSITKTVARMLWLHKKVFLSLALIYGVLNLVLVRGFTGGLNVSDLKGQLDQAFSGHLAALATSATVFASLVSTSGNTSNSTGGAYQTFLLLIMSLAVIWALRMTLAGEAFRLRDSFYKGMYPLVPFLLVFVVIGLQLLPLVIGAGIYSLVVSSGIAVNAFQQILWGIGCAALVALSLYWLTASLFALYIVTLPNMTPRKALRSARELIRGRRLSVLRKLLFLPLALFLAAIVIMLPVILLAAPLAQWLFFLLTMCSLVVVHAYMYTVYRELLA